METEQKTQVLEFFEKKKVIVVIVAVILSIVAICLISELANRSSVKSQLKAYYEAECKLEDVAITLKKSDDKYNLYDYYVYVECSNLSDFTYEEMMKFEYYLDVDDVDIMNYTCNGDTYVVYTTSVYKNGDKVYEKKSSSSSSSHKCIECGASASRSYKSPFSGQTEWYCSSCYRELQDLLEQFGMN